LKAEIWLRRSEGEPGVVEESCNEIGPVLDARSRFRTAAAS
jgi:hypothetical protein